MAKDDLGGWIDDPGLAIWAKTRGFGLARKAIVTLSGDPMAELDGPGKPYRYVIIDLGNNHWIWIWMHDDGRVQIWLNEDCGELKTKIAEGVLNCDAGELRRFIGDAFEPSLVGNPGDPPEWPPQQSREVA
jgi:hypothetical protein